MRAPQNSTLSKNMATLGNGGCLELGASMASVELANSTASEHSAGGSGGVLYSSNSISQMVVQGVQLSNNLAGSSGGCVSSSGRLGTFRLQSCSVSGSKAAMQGGTLELTGQLGEVQLIDVRSAGSSATVGSGGLAYFSGTVGNLTISGLQAQGCLAGEHGGCVIVKGNATNVTVTGSHILSANAAGSGGALHLQASAGQVTFTNSTLEECTASAAGGAVSLVGSLAAVTVAGCSLVKNRASGAQGGGAIYAELAPASPSVTFSLQRTNCSGNAAQTGGCLSLVANLNGSAVGGPTFSVALDSSIFGTNSAQEGGGGVSLVGTSQTQLTVQNTSFSYNKAGQGSAGAGSGVGWQPMGAGLLIAGAVQATLTSSSFDHNSAGRGAGGGLALASPSAVLTGRALSFSSNVAARGSGGSLAAGNDTRLLLSNCTFQQDTAQRHGGSLAALSSQVNISTSSFSLCTANGWGGCVYIRGAQQLAITTSSFGQGSSGLGGGGLALYDNGIATVENCKVEVGPPLLAPADPSLPTQPVRRRSLLQQAAANSSDTCQSVTVVSTSSAMGGGVYAGGRTNVIITGTNYTISPRSVGWQGAGLAIKLNPETTCGAPGVSPGQSCNAVVMVGSIMEAVDGWAPSATERLLFTSSMAGWSASCDVASSSSAVEAPPPPPCAAGNSTEGCQPVSRSALPPSPSPASPAPGLAEQGMNLLQGLQAGTSRNAQLPSCSVKGIELSLLSSLVLLPPVKLAFSGPVNVTNSRATLLRDPTQPTAIFADTTSVFSLTVELRDESGQLVTVHSK